MNLLAYIMRKFWVCHMGWWMDPSNKLFQTLQATNPFLSHFLALVGDLRVIFNCFMTYLLATSPTLSEVHYVHWFLFCSLCPLFTENCTWHPHPSPKIALKNAWIRHDVIIIIMVKPGCTYRWIFFLAGFPSYGSWHAKKKCNHHFSLPDGGLRLESGISTSTNVISNL